MKNGSSSPESLEYGIIDFSDAYLGSKKSVEIHVKGLFRVQKCEIKELLGGLTNTLYLCELLLENDEKSRILVRTNGKISDLLIDRKKELQIIQQLSKLGYMKLFSVFQNGIVYEFQEGRSLTRQEARNSELPHYLNIAKAIAIFHKIEIDLSDCSVSSITNMEKWVKKLGEEIEKEQFIKTSTEAKLSGSSKKRTITDSTLKIFESEISFVKNMSLIYCKEIVFSHNDLLSENIIFNESSEQYKFIDFEYSGMNYRGFDLGEHISQYRDIKSQEDRFIPSQEMTSKFLTEYLSEYHSIPHEDISEQQIKEFYLEMILGKLQGNLMYSIWAFYSGIICSVKNYDYFSHGWMRFAYFEEKEVFLHELRKRKGDNT